MSSQAPGTVARFASNPDSHYDCMQVTTGAFGMGGGVDGTDRDRSPGTVHDVLDRLTRVTARLAGVPAAFLMMSIRDGMTQLQSVHGLSAADATRALEDGPSDDPHWFIAGRYPIRGASGAEFGVLYLLDTVPRPEFVPAAPLDDLLALLRSARERDMRLAGAVHRSDRNYRADRLMRRVSEAVTCAEALASLLAELCHFHQATIGRIWEMKLPQEDLIEVSRFNGDDLDAQSYYRHPPSAPIDSRNMIVAQAIRENKPQALIYSHITNPERYVLLSAAVASGLRSQVSVPIQVEEQRFGISLSFQTERDDLHVVVEDINSLADAIRPALFRKVVEERIRFVAHHDDLTQLANRLVFHERMAAAVDAARRGEQGLALLYLDLDGFKAVNDSRGHEVGDKLLTAVAGRLREGVREGDTVARMGGDEFAVVQPLGGQPIAATKLALRLLERINEPYIIDGQSTAVGASIGVAIYPDDGETPDVLLRNADTALYRAKQAGRNTYRLFEPAMDGQQQERLLIERDMGEAIDRQHFTLVYQPICETASAEVRGFEALLRWDHPSRGPITPDQFVPMAESSGLILPLGAWALEAACAEAVRWPRPAYLSVNLSPMQFRQPDLPEQIAAILERTGLPPHRLDLEVTEGLLLDDSGVVLRTMNALKAQGVRITLDDFGTAYASLSYLRRFPFDRIKIDKSFVQGMCHDGVTLAIVEAILSLSRKLQLTVVAEGVERPNEMELLRELGCDLVQGFLTGVPMPAEDVMALLAVSGTQKVEVASLVGL